VDILPEFQKLFTDAFPQISPEGVSSEIDRAKNSSLAMYFQELLPEKCHNLWKNIHS